MIRRSTIAVVLTAVVGMMALLAGCDNNGPIDPTPPAVPIVVSVTGLELIGPESIPPGQSIQFRATARLSDGSSRDVTNEASWGPGNPRILTVSSTGIVTGHQRGETSLSVGYEGRVATRSAVFVLPDGTYRVRGNIRDEGLPVFGANVSVIHGSVPTLSTTSNGEYSLYGVSGPTELRVTKIGYAEQRRQLTVMAHETVDFDLQPAEPRPNLAGSYRLTITAAPTCTGALPEIARARRYLAAIGQTGPRLEVTLADAVFETIQGRLRNGFSGSVEPGRLIIFSLQGFYRGYYGYYSPDVVERLDDSSSLAMSGVAYAGLGPSTVEGSLVGRFQLLDRQYRELTSCESNAHRFLLSR